MAYKFSLIKKNAYRDNFIASVCCLPTFGCKLVDTAYFGMEIIFPLSKYTRSGS